MRHWAENYVGIPYCEFDCAELCKKVLLEQFDKVVKIPVKRPDNLRKISDMIINLQGDFATKIDHPKEGDAVLMVGKGRINHIGIVCFINGQIYVLHAMRNAGMSVLHKISALRSNGIELEGYYRWI